MKRVVVDTNVFVSSFFGGYPKKVVDLWKTGRIHLCLSRSIIEEYMTVLQRLGLQNTDELNQLLRVFASGHNNVFAAKVPTLNIVSDDPDDNRFIECAVALKAEAIVSGDRHLKSIGNYMGIPIMTPKAFIDKFRFDSQVVDDS